MKRLIVKFKDGHTNLAVTDVTREGDVVFAYNGTDFVGMFDMGAVDALYVSEVRE